MNRDAVAQDPLPQTRMLSLDAFRGFDIAAMLLVNMTWDETILPSQLFHVPWRKPGNNTSRPSQAAVRAETRDGPAACPGAK